MARPNPRMKHLELDFDADRRSSGRSTPPNTDRYSPPARAHLHSRNTLGPSEDVLENRNYRRKRVIMEQDKGRHTRNNIRENVFFLLLLGLSIYGTYHLFIYILNR